MDPLLESTAPFDAALLDTLSRLGIDAREIERILPSYGVGRSRHGSRTVCFTSGRRESVLNIFAKAKYPQFDELKYKAFWKKPDPGLEIPDNMEIKERPSPAQKTTGRRTWSKLGLRAGTPEYYKAYRAANPDRFKAAAKRYNEKNRERLAALRAASPEKVAVLGDALASIVGEEFIEEVLPERTKPRIETQPPEFHEVPDRVVPSESVLEEARRKLEDFER
jgi:hypothetical protein